MEKPSVHKEVNSRAASEEVMDGCNATLAAEELFDANDVPSANEIFNFSLAEVCSILKEKQRDDRHVSGATELVLILVYSVLIAAGLLTNLAVIFVVARRTQMHTPRNLYIVNLTVSDISLCIVCMPFTLVALLTRRWTLGEYLCKMVPALQGANIMVSTGTIATIALDRYFTIVRRSPPDSASSNAKRRVVLSIAAVWFLSITAALPLLFSQHVESFAVQNLVLYETCIESWPSPEAKLAYTLGTLIVMYVIPIGVVVAVHARIAAFLRAHATQHCVSADVSEVSAARAQREIARNRRTTVLLSGIAVLFAISWLPHNLLSVLVDAEPGIVTAEQLYVATAVCHVIAMSSAVTNPIVYGWLNTNIRREFIDLLPPRIIQCCGKNRSSLLDNRRGANGAGRSGVDREGFGLSAGAGLLGETTAVDDKVSPARNHVKNSKMEHATTILLLPRGASTTAPRSMTVSTQLVSEL